MSDKEIYENTINELDKIIKQLRKENQHYLEEYELLLKEYNNFFDKYYNAKFSILELFGALRDNIAIAHLGDYYTVGVSVNNQVEFKIITKETYETLKEVLGDE